MRYKFNMIDDRSITGNPFNTALWCVRKLRGQWTVLDGLGNPIHEAESKAACDGWIQERLIPSPPR